jgi:prolyl-tRNA editing enzyme YbaK/EbsC (Cys-tRNA(Pro) deacylase)
LNKNLAEAIITLQLTEFVSAQVTVFMSPDIRQQICEILRQSEITFREVEHQPTSTSEESARARGEPLGVGAKAIVARTDDLFRLFVLPADQKLVSAAIKKTLKVKKIRFATPEELLNLTGLVPGSVPPFGHPILPLELFGDDSVGQHDDKIAFNAGSLTNSIIMSATDWKKIAKPRQFAFAKKS